MKGRSKRSFPNQFDLLVERFDVYDGTFILVPYEPNEAAGNDSLFRATSSGTQRALTELEKPNKGETNGYFIDRYRSVVFARWWGLGIFSLAPVAPAGPTS